jgi:hypothetical protein
MKSLEHDEIELLIVNKEQREEIEPHPSIGRRIFLFFLFMCSFCVVIPFTVAKIYSMVSLDKEISGNSIYENRKKEPATAVPNESSKEDDQTKPKDDKDFFDKIIWPPLQHSLCGTGAPNLTLSSTLFELARTEAFENDYPRVPVPSNASTTKTKFFSGEYHMVLMFFLARMKMENAFTRCIQEYGSVQTTRSAQSWKRFLNIFTWEASVKSDCPKPFRKSRTMN